MDGLHAAVGRAQRSALPVQLWGKGSRVDELAQPDCVAPGRQDARGGSRPAIELAAHLLALLATGLGVPLSSAACCCFQPPSARRGVDEQGNLTHPRDWYRHASLTDLTMGADATSLLSEYDSFSSRDGLDKYHKLELDYESAALLSLSDAELELRGSEVCRHALRFKEWPANLRFIEVTFSHPPSGPISISRSKTVTCDISQAALAAASRERELRKNAGDPPPPASSTAPTPGSPPEPLHPSPQRHRAPPRRTKHVRKARRATASR